MVRIVIIAAAAMISTLGVGCVESSAQTTKSRTDLTAGCFATYMTLAKAADKLESNAEQDRYIKQSGQGIERLRPYVRQAEKLQSPSSFFDKAVKTRMEESRKLDFLGSNDPARRSLVERLAADASKCDALVAEWSESQNN